MGILVFINGKIKGIDTLSSPVAYHSLHEKLLKSYALEAVLDKINVRRVVIDTKKEAEEFIKQIKESNESKHKSIGHGGDHRFVSDSVLGSALICQDEVIHASFFKNEIKENESGQMAGFRMRKGFRA